MTCMDCHACEPLYGFRRCVTCLPAAEEREKQRKYAWYRAYYRRVIRKRRGHKTEYSNKTLRAEIDRHLNAAIRFADAPKAQLKQHNLGKRQGHDR